MKNRTMRLSSLDGFVTLLFLAILFAVGGQYGYDIATSGAEEIDYLIDSISEGITSVL